jgi:hypothetical protein
MFRILSTVIHCLYSLLKSRVDLMVENAVLCQQLAVLKHRQPRPRLRGSDWLLWILLRRVSLAFTTGVRGAILHPSPREKKRLGLSSSRL